MVIGGLVLWVMFGGQRTDFNAVGLGVNVTSVFKPGIHCTELIDGESCLAQSQSRPAKRRILWLGNSQLHGVVAYHPAQDVTATVQVHDRQALRGNDVVAFSPASSNFKEYLLLHSFLKPRLHYDTLIIQATFAMSSDARVRKSLVEVTRDPNASAALENSDVGRKVTELARGSTDKWGINLDKAPGGWLVGAQRTIETVFSSFLNHHLGFFALREEARGRFLIGIYDFRNWFFGVTAESREEAYTRNNRVRAYSIEEAPYRLNLASLAAVLANSRSSGISVAVYVAPAPNKGLDAYYDLAQYAEFKRELAELCLQYGALFANFETLVPDEEWTIVGDRAGIGNKDILHFTGAGQNRLADAVCGLIDSLQGEP